MRKQKNDHYSNQRGEGMKKIKPPICPKCNRRPLPLGRKYDPKKKRWVYTKTHYKWCWWCYKYDKHPELLNFEE